MKTNRLLATAALFAAITFAGRLQGYAATIYEPYTFTTIAGKAGTSGSIDGAGSAARFIFGTDIYARGALAADSAGNLYLAESANRILRKITIEGTNAVVATIAGRAGWSGSADGPGNMARFNSPGGVAVDAKGNIFVSDSYNTTLRKVSPDGTNWVVTTIAGKAGFRGIDDGLGSNARFVGNVGLALNSSGTLFVADGGAIRKVTQEGTNWMVTTIAGNSNEGGFVDGIGIKARFAAPGGLGIDAAGNIYVADSDNMVIRKVTLVDTNWVVTTPRPNLSGEYFESLTADSAGNVYVPGLISNTILKVGTNGVTTVLAGKFAGSTDGTGSAARFNQPSALVVGNNGIIFVVDSVNNTIRMGYPLLTITASGFNSGQFGFSLKGGPAGRMAVVETSADMVGWLPIWTNTLGGILNFSDPQSSGQSQRFYRAQTK